MSEKPILFKGEMVKAILEDRKTQTRRIIKPQPTHFHKFPNKPIEPCKSNPDGTCAGEIKPRYAVGDLLWVREPFRIDRADAHRIWGRYTRDNSILDELLSDSEWEKFCDWKKPLSGKSSLYMFKSLTRLWLKVKSVRAEQIWDITWQDCRAEGIVLVGDELVFNNQKQKQSLFKTKFISLWDSINKKRGYGWDENNWVWVYDFERHIK